MNWRWIVLVPYMDIHGVKFEVMYENWELMTFCWSLLWELKACLVEIFPSYFKLFKTWRNCKDPNVSGQLSNDPSVLYTKGCHLSLFPSSHKFYLIYDKNCSSCLDSYFYGNSENSIIAFETLFCLIFFLLHIDLISLSSRSGFLFLVLLIMLLFFGW